MKRFYSRISGMLAMAVVAFGMSTAAFAQQTQRKTWDFGKGFSDETIANLNADTKNWAEQHNTDGVTDQWKNNAKVIGIAMANGQVIQELDGIEWLSNGQSGSNDLHLYHDRKNIRINRKGMKFKTPKLAPGQTFTILAKSANATATDRGLVGDENVDYIEGPENGICVGKDVDGISDYRTLVWKVKETLTDSVQVTISTSPNAGLDILLFQIDNGDGPALDVAHKVAYIGNEAASQGFDEAQIALEASTDRVELTYFESSDTEVTLESLQEFEAVVISPFVEVEDAMVPVLRSAIAYEPVVNLNGTLAEAWGLAKVVPADATTATVPEQYLDLELFTDVLEEGALNLFVDGAYAFELGAYFAEDDVLAEAAGLPVIHQHNAGRNTYLGVPVNAENIALNNPDVFSYLVTNAAVYAAASKKDITAAGAPTISQVNKDKYTEVSINVSNKKSVIYYTINGEDPTAESTVYTEPFTLTEAATVKAMATLDGYNNSKVSSLDIVIKEQAAKPEISLVKEETSTTVTLSCATEGAEVYYSFCDKVTEAIKAQKYEEPIVLSKEPSFIYAFATGEGLVNSEIASEYVSINSINANTIRTDTVSHFNGSTAQWFGENLLEVNAAGEESKGNGNAGTYYYWLASGKAAWSYYGDEVESSYEKEVLDEEGKPKLDDNGVPMTETVYVYKPDPAALRVATSLTDPDWRLVSRGQVMIHQELKPEARVGNGEAGYYAETAEDFIGGAPSNQNIQFGAVASGNPCTGAIESTRTFKAPFDVVVYLASCQNNSKAVMEVQTSTDGENWTKVGELNVSPFQRYYKKSRVSVDNEGDFYVRVAHTANTTGSAVLDLYIFNNGDVSKQYDPESIAGVQNVADAAVEAIATEYYNLNGVRLSQPAAGINIVRTVFSDGTSTIKKVIRK